MYVHAGRATVEVWMKIVRSGSLGAGWVDGWMEDGET